MIIQRGGPTLSSQDFEEIRRRVWRQIAGAKEARGHQRVMEFVGIHNTYAESGTPEQLLEKYGLVARNIVEAVRKALGRKKS